MVVRTLGLVELESLGQSLVLTDLELLMRRLSSLFKECLV